MKRNYETTQKIRFNYSIFFQLCTDEDIFLNNL